MRAVDARAAGLFLGIGVHPRLSCAGGGYCLRCTRAAQRWPLAIPWLSSFCESLLMLSGRRGSHSLGLLAHGHAGGIGSVGNPCVKEVDGQQEHQDRGSSALHELGRGGCTRRARGGKGTTDSQSIFAASHLYCFSSFVPHQRASAEDAAELELQSEMGDKSVKAWESSCAGELEIGLVYLKK